MWQNRQMPKFAIETQNEAGDHTSTGTGIR